MHFTVLALATPEGRGERGVNVGGLERRVSAIGGGALVLLGLTRRSWSGLLFAALGGGLAYRGLTGHCHTYAALGVNRAQQGHSPVASVAHGQGIKVERVVTINKPSDELYRFWRDFENLPRFMRHLEAVSVQDDKHSHWTVKAPLGQTVEWDAEIINELPGELIAWRSLAGASIGNAGSVRFSPTAGGRGTEVKVTLEYDPPAGKLGATVAKILGEEPDQQVGDDLRRFKQLMEAGETPTTEGQSSARAGDRREGLERPAAQKIVQQPAVGTGALDVVQVASEGSFPASDPPAWSRAGADQAPDGKGAGGA